MEGYIKKPTQEQRILEILRNACGQYVDGMIFLRLESPITQYHARIWDLQRQGYVIEGEWVEGKNWKKYRLVSEQPPKTVEQVHEAYVVKTVDAFQLTDEVQFTDARTPETLLNLEKAKQISFL